MKSSSPAAHGCWGTGAPPQPLQACGACKYQRKKCTADCLLAPFFRPEEMDKWKLIQDNFGASNVKLFIAKLKPEYRQHYVTSMAFEARARMLDPVLGTLRIISRLNDQVTALQEEVVSLRRQLQLDVEPSQEPISPRPDLQSGSSQGSFSPVPDLQPLRLKDSSADGQKSSSKRQFRGFPSPPREGCAVQRTQGHTPCNFHGNDGHGARSSLCEDSVRVSMDSASRKRPLSVEGGRRVRESTSSTPTSSEGTEAGLCERVEDIVLDRNSSWEGCAEEALAVLVAESRNAAAPPVSTSSLVKSVDHLLLLADCSAIAEEPAEPVTTEVRARPRIRLKC